MIDAYVYAIMIDGVARYVGKGSGIFLKRATEHLRTAKRLLRRREAGERLWASNLYNRLAKAHSAGSVISIAVIARDLSDDEAFDRERTEIEAAPKGQLWNLDGGGLGGKRISEEHRRKMSEAAKRRLQRPGELDRLRKLGSRLENVQRLKQFANNGRDPRILEINRASVKSRWKNLELAKRMKSGLDKGRKTRWGRSKCQDQLEFL